MTDHAINNARSWAETISDGIAAMQALERGEETATFDGEEFDDSNTVRERLEEMPLSVRVRDGWRNPGEESDGAEEFEILLSTGARRCASMARLTAITPCNGRIGARPGPITATPRTNRTRQSPPLLACSICENDHA